MISRGREYIFREPPGTESWMLELFVVAKMAHLRSGGLGVDVDLRSVGVMESKGNPEGTPSNKG